MDRKLVKSAISYALKAAYFAAILSLVVFFLWKSQVAVAFSAASFLCALIIEALLFLLGFGLFTETKPVLAAALVSFALLGALSIFLASDTPLYFISSCSMLPNYQQGDAVLVLDEALNVPMVKIDVPYSEGKAEVYGGNETLAVDGSLYLHCSRSGGELCNRFISAPFGFYEIRGPVLFQYDSCARSDGTASPCVISATIGGTAVPSSSPSDVVVFPGSYAAADSSLRIAHRAMFGINDSLGNVYYFTKGDNAPVYDVQLGGSAVPAGSLQGKVALRLPLLGALSKNYNSSLANTGCGSHYT